MYYPDEEEWAYRYEVSAPSYIQAAQHAEVNGLRLREWNWNPNNTVSIRDKRASE